MAGSEAILSVETRVFGRKGAERTFSGWRRRAATRRSSLAGWRGGGSGDSSWAAVWRELVRDTRLWPRGTHDEEGALDGVRESYPTATGHRA